MVQSYYEHQFLFWALIQCFSSLLLVNEELFDPTDLPLDCLTFILLFLCLSLCLPNESNLLNYFIFSFLVKRLRGGK